MLKNVMFSKYMLILLQILLPISAQLKVRLANPFADMYSISCNYVTPRISIIFYRFEVIFQKLVNFTSKLRNFTFFLSIENFFLLWLQLNSMFNNNQFVIFLCFMRSTQRNNIISVSRSASRISHLNNYIFTWTTRTCTFFLCAKSNYKCKIIFLILKRNKPYTVRLHQSGQSISCKVINTHQSWSLSSNTK